MRWWKVLGLAGVAGVAATGVLLARAERRRRAYTPDEVRTRLHTRHAEALARSGQADAEDGRPGGGAGEDGRPGVGEDGRPGGGAGEDGRPGGGVGVDRNVG
jgi:hypothetical protein